MRIKNLVLVSCVLCAVAAFWLIWEIVLSGAAADPAADGAAGLRSGDEPGAAFAGPGETAEPDEEMQARASGREAVEPPSRSEPGGGEDDDVLPGTVLYHVVPADRAERIDSVNIRFMNKNRFASHHGSAAGRVHLSEGVYECAVVAGGYDLSMLSDVQVLSGETNDLGVIVMHPGTSRIEGVVNAYFLNLEEPIVVELYGSGRRPCVLCRGAAVEAAGCPCGFTPGKTTRVLTFDRRFVFDGLAGGTYFLRARSSTAKHADHRRIELERGGCAAVAVDLVPEVSVRFHLARETGRPFFSGMEAAEGDWTFESELFEAVMFSFRRGDRLIAQGTAYPSFGDFIVEIFEEDEMSIDAPFTRAVDPGRPRPIDRRREPGDAFVPAFSMSPPNPVTLEVRTHDNNSMTLFPLPALRLEAEVRYEGFSSGTFPLDLERYGGRSISVVLKKE